MDERSREGYFQPFRSAFEEGTGLGAAIVYRLVEEHGGASRIDSVPGRGTTIHIFVPQVRDGAPKSVDASARGCGRSPSMNRVLVVEDEKSMRDLLSLMLRKEGYAVEVAQSGTQAAARIAKDPCTISSSPTCRCRA